MSTYKEISVSGRSKSLEDTEKAIKHILPSVFTEGDEKAYRVVYAVHELLPSSDSDSKPTNPEEIPCRFIGLITLRSLSPDSLALPPHFFPESTRSAEVLTAELGYQFLPTAWGKGFAGESISAVFQACERAPTFWAPYDKVYVRAIVNSGNPASQRVMTKIGVPRLGVYEWKGKALFLAGKWRERDTVWIYGMFVRE